MNRASLMVVEVRCAWKAHCELCQAPRTVATCWHRLPALVREEKAGRSLQWAALPGTLGGVHLQARSPAMFWE